MFINHIKSLFLLLFLPAILLVSCSKNSSVNELSYTINNSEPWYADKVESYVVNDTLYITGKKNKSEILIIVSDIEVGDYPIADGDLSNPLENENVSIRSLVIVNPSGSDNQADKFISTDGIISITSSDRDKRTIKGTFNIKAIKGIDILNPKRHIIKGEFESKYRKF